MPDLSAVAFCHEFLAARLHPGGLYLDATCGNGHDTLFLCRLAGEGGRVLGLDIQPAAVEATNRRLAAAGYGAVGRAVLCDHRDLLTVVPPGTADCVVFNFGWLPGADHTVHSAAATTLPALEAALAALKPGGVLAAVLYSGKVIGEGEKQAALRFFESLPLARYTVLVCRFANWADTAPLPLLCAQAGRRLSRSRSSASSAASLSAVRTRRGNSRSALALGAYRARLWAVCSSSGKSA